MGVNKVSSWYVWAAVGDNGRAMTIEIGMMDEILEEVGAGRSGYRTPLARYLGTTLRDRRQRLGLTLAAVAHQVGISRSMLSKIETAQTATSLESLGKLAEALGISLSTLFRDYNLPAGSAQLIKQGEGMEVVRQGTKRGHTYHLLAYEQGVAKQRFEPFLITLNDESEVFATFEHPGVEFIHMLAGQLEYRHGQTTYRLEPGDSLTFRGDVPHGPETLLVLPIQFLAIIYYPAAATPQGE
jgi:transcriptional regulator with XRE-family HTH domain